MKKRTLGCFFLSLILLSASILATPILPSTKNQVPTLKEKTKENASASLNIKSKISINKASAEELSHGLNGIGLKKAEAIISYREKYGPFTKIEQLKDVPGVGNAIFERNQARLML